MKVGSNGSYSRVVVDQSSRQLKAGCTPNFIPKFNGPCQLDILRKTQRYARMPRWHCGRDNVVLRKRSFCDFHKSL